MKIAADCHAGGKLILTLLFLTKQAPQPREHVPADESAAALLCHEDAA